MIYVVKLAPDIEKRKSSIKKPGGRVVSSYFGDVVSVLMNEEEKFGL